MLYGKGFIVDQLCGLTFKISAQSFYQINHEQCTVLYHRILALLNLHQGDIILDTYCGIGTIGMFLAQYVQTVIGVEINKEAYKDAINNAKMNHISNIHFVNGDASEFMHQLAIQKQKVDCVVMDPPRAGSTKTFIEAIRTLQPRQVVYVSCDPTTQARDLKMFAKIGYQSHDVYPVDMFPHTEHVEVVCLLSKLKTYKHIDVELEMDELDLTAAESKATYAEIKQYVLDKTGLKVSQLYIARVKRKHGLIERINFNLGEKEPKVPQVPPEKEQAIENALRYFKMI